MILDSVLLLVTVVASVTVVLIVLFAIYRDKKYLYVTTTAGYVTVVNNEIDCWKATNE